MLKETISSFPFRLSEVNSDAKAYKFIETIKIGGKMSTSKEMVEEKIKLSTWIALAALAFVLSFLTMLSFCLLGMLPGAWQCGYNLGMISRVTCYVVWPYLLLTLMYPLRRRFKVSGSMLTYLWAVGNMASYTLGFAYLATDWSIRPAFFQQTDPRGIFKGIWWMPPLSEVQAMVRGGVETNWAHWGPIVFVMSLQYITFFFFTSSVVLIFRHAWMDVEMIPFPLALAGYEIVRMIESGGESKPKRLAEPFWIGFILAFVYGIPIFMARTFPWFPDIYAWRESCPSGAVHVPETDIIAQTIVGYYGYSKDMIALAMALLVPLTTLFNVWFWTFVMWILDQAAYMMGAYSGVLSMPSWARMCCYKNTPGWDAPFRWNLFSMVGGFLALAVMQIFLRRQYLLTTIKAALGRATPEWERSEPMSYRSMYIMLAISIIACIISCQILLIDFWASLLLIAFNCFTTWLAMLMLFGLGAFGASDCRIWPVWTMRIRWPTRPPEPTASFVMSHQWAFWGSNVVSFGFGNGFFTTALNLKMAKLTGTNLKNVFWVGAMAMIISVPTIFATRVWLANMFGTRVGLPTWYLGIDRGETCLDYVYSLPSNETFLTYGAVGFIITAALAILHARFIWFPFEPIGFIIATNFGGFWNCLWSVFLAAWIIKTIVIRVGGSKLYEEWVIPAVGGFAAGIAIVTLFGCIAGMVRFFIPF